MKTEEAERSASSVFLCPVRAPFPPPLLPFFLLFSYKIKLKINKIIRTRRVKAVDNDNNFSLKNLEM